MNQNVQPHSGAWVTFTYASFSASAFMVAIGVYFLPLDLWEKGYLSMGIVMLVQSWCSEASCHSSGCKSRRHRSPIDVVVISSVGKGDRPVESLDVKASGGWVVSQSDPSRGGEQADRP